MQEENIDFKSLKSEDIKKVKECVEKLPTSKTPAQYTKVFDALKQIESMLDKYSELGDQAQLFLKENVVYQCLNYVLNHKQYPSEILNEAFNFIKSAIKFILDNLVSFKLSEAFRAVFDPARGIYENNLQQTDEHAYMVKHLGLLNPVYLGWVNQLKQEDFVDAIKIERLTKRACWSRAQVFYRNGTDISVRFLNEKNYGNDRIISIEACELAPYKSRTPHYEQILQLSTGDLIDACDVAQIWITSTILEILIETNQHNELVVEYKIGYRIYKENGIMEEEVSGKRFDGWSSQYDEVIPANSPRLAWAYTQAKSLCKHSSSQNVETIVDDGNDLLYDIEYKNSKFYGILRPKQSKSMLFVDVVNYFGSIGGFDRILQIIQNQDDWLQVKFLANYVQGIGNIHAQLYREFAKEFVPKFKAAVEQNLLKSPESNVRNMGREKLDQIVKGLENLLKRPYSLSQKFEIVESLILDLVLLCFKSDFLDKKIQALKYLVDVWKSVQTNQFRSITNNYLLKWVGEHKIFEEIFNVNAHVELVSRSNEFLRYFLIAGEDVFTETHMERLWQLLIKEDKEMKPIIFKVFTDIAISMKEYQVAYFQSKIAQLNISDMGIEHITLLYEMNRYQIRSYTLLQQCIELLWVIVKYWSTKEQFLVLLDNQQLKTSEIEEKARSLTCELFGKLQNRNDKVRIMQELLNNIQTDQAVSSSLKCLSHLIQSFPTRPTEMETYTQELIVKELINECQIVNLLIQSIINLRSLITKPEQDWPLEFLNQYMNKLQERVLLLKTLIRISGKPSLVANKQFLQFLWGIVMKALCKRECDLISTWIRQLIENTEEEFTQQWQLFFQETFIPQNNQTLPEQAFETFQAMLCQVNVNCGKFKKIDYKIGNAHISSVNQHGQVTSISSNTGDDENKPTTEYYTTAHPNEVVGLKYLWTLVYSQNSDNVLERAAQLLVRIYCTTSNEMLPKVIREFIDLVLNQNNVTRSLMLLTSLLNESEKRGVGTLTSLSGLVQGDLMTFNITNEIVGASIKKFDVRMYSNRTVIELRLAIARKAQIAWESTKLIRSNLFNQNRELNDTDNGKTLAEVKLRNGEALQLNFKRSPPVPQVSLLDENGQMCSKFKEIVIDWFKQFAGPNMMMSQEQCRCFVQRCTGEHCTLEDTRVSGTFEQFDRDRDGLLSLDDFLEFYNEAVQVRTQAVWKNLHAYNYRNDLTKINEGLLINDERVLPRYVLSTNPKFYESMFKLLKEDKTIAEPVWKLLNRLPASEAVLNSLMNVQELKNDWSKMFPEDSPYRLLYSLKLIEYLMSDDEPTDLSPEIQQETTDEQVNETHQKPTMEFETKKPIESKWRQEFIAYGGFEQLSKVFKRAAAITHKGDKGNSINNNIISFILIVMRNYIAAALHPVIPEIYKIQQYVRQTHYTLDQITQNFKQDKEELNKPAVVVPQNSIVDVSEFTFPTKKVTKARVKESEEFLALVERLRGELGQKILQTLDMQSLISELVFIVELFLKKEGDLESEERQITEYALALFVTLVIYDQEGCQKLYLKQKCYSFLCEGIFTPKNILVRKMFSHAIYLITEFTGQNGYAGLAFLLCIFPTTEDTSKKESQQYYETFCKLIEIYDLSQEQLLPDSFVNIVDKISYLLINHVSTEKRSSISFDKSLCGYLGILLSVLKKVPTLAKDKVDLAQFLMDICLFELQPQRFVEGSLPELLQKDLVSNEINVLDYSPENYVKCKSYDSRRVVYKLLVQLVKQQPQIYDQVMRQRIQQLLCVVPVCSQMNFKPSSEIKSYQGYVGIRNLGCICYMNAMIQQFYMTPAFRYAILMADDGKEQQLVEQVNGIMVDDNIIHQFQRLFAFLEFSDRPDYSPSKFCFAFKDFQGKPVNVSIQQDAQEFLNMIFDKLENGLGGWRQVVEGVFGGKTCNQVICKGCGYVRERDELFYNLSLPIKGVKHIHDSLKHFIEGETINGFFCEECKTKNDIIKRQCLSQLPNVLIMHLQRIVFNLDTLLNEKISSKLEFPPSLNLEPYTREGLQLRENNQEPLTDQAKYRLRDQSYYEYKLKGVVVHRGTAQYGHYYSYVNYKNDKWIELNDSTIRDFDPRKIPNECYGGRENTENTEDAATISTAPKQTPNGTHISSEASSTNAYILVYERSYKTDIHMEFKTPQDREGVLEKLGKNDQNSNELQLSIPFDSFKRFIPQSLYKEVWLDNHQFMLEKHIYSDDFFGFFKQILESIPLPLNYSRQNNSYHGIYNEYPNVQNVDMYSQLLEQGTYILTEIMSRAYESSGIKDYVPLLKDIANIIPTHVYLIFKRCIIDRWKRVSEVLISGPDVNVRTAISQLIVHYLNVIIFIHGLTLDIQFETAEVQLDPKVDCEKTIVTFLNGLLRVLNTDVAKNWMKFGQYFELIRDFVASGQYQFNWALQVQLISVLADFFMEKGSPLWAGPPEPNPIKLDFGTKKHNMGNKFTLPQYPPLLQCIAYMVRQSQFSANDIICLKSQFFYQKGLTEGNDVNSLNSIIVHMCWKNPELSFQIATIILQGIMNANCENVQPYCKVLEAYLGIADDCSGHRTQWILGLAQPAFIGQSDSCACKHSISDVSLTFATLLPLVDQGPPSLLNTLFVNRKRYESYTIVLLRSLLQISLNNNTLFAWLATSPSPSYMYANYIDWWGPYIQNYLQESKKYQDTTIPLFNKVELGEETLKAWESFAKKLEDNDFWSPPQGKLWQSIKPIYIMGQNFLVEEISSTPIDQGVTLICQEHTIWLAESQPCRDPPTNLVFPKSVLYDDQFIQILKIDPNSNILNLLAQTTHIEKINGIPTAPPIAGFQEHLKENQSNLVDGIDFSTTLRPKIIIPQEVPLEQPKNNQKQMVDEQSNLEAIPLPAPSSAIPLPPPEYILIDIPLIQSRFIRKYILKNDTDSIVYLTLSFNSQYEDNINTILPQMVYAVIPPKSSHVVVCLMKVVATEDWGLFEFTATINYSNQPNKTTEIKQQKSTTKETKVSEAVQVYPSSEYVRFYHSFLKTDIEAVKACSQCTVIQSTQNAFCECCGSNFD